MNIQKHEAEPMKEPKEYKSFVYSYECIPAKEDTSNQAINQQQVLVTVKSHNMNVELHSGTEIHFCIELQNEVEAHSDSAISRVVELPDRGAQSDAKIERSSEETRAEPRLSKCVKRHL